MQQVDFLGELAKFPNGTRVEIEYKNSTSEETQIAKGALVFLEADGGYHLRTDPTTFLELFSDPSVTYYSVRKAARAGRSESREPAARQQSAERAWQNQAPQPQQVPIATTDTQEAASIVEDARREAERIIQDAKDTAARIIAAAKAAASRYDLQRKPPQPRKEPQRDDIDTLTLVSTTMVNALAGTATALHTLCPGLQVPVTVAHPHMVFAGHHFVKGITGVRASGQEWRQCLLNARFTPELMACFTPKGTPRDREAAAAVEAAGAKIRLAEDSFEAILAIYNDSLHPTRKDDWFLLFFAGASVMEAYASARSGWRDGGAKVIAGFLAAWEKGVVDFGALFPKQTHQQHQPSQHHNNQQQSFRKPPQVQRFVKRI